ncbi:hypothetical protein [Neisseria bergeri]|uniref:hypothetical protein n=1 Tax=Neisseria bergeri TaxID=1906581 RepID=UPI0027DED754|nr:hypothetical protein [Neisseria bergeri]
MANAKKKPLFRHSRAGGNPDFDLKEKSLYRHSRAGGNPDFDLKEKSLYRHSRAGGNPDLDLSKIFKVNRYFKLPDSRLRGNDEISIFYFNPQ